METEEKIYNVSQLADPSSLTTQQLWREIAALKELLYSRIESLDENQKSRIEELENKIDNAHTDLVRVPTEVTKAVVNLRDLIEAEIRSTESKIEANKHLLLSKIDAAEKVATTTHEGMARVPADTQLAVMNLKLLHDERFHSLDEQNTSRIQAIDKRLEDLSTLLNEKFAGVEKQFKERDVRVEQTARDTKVAVDAALQASEKAVGKQNESFALSIAKSETATMKQIDQQAAIIGNATKSLDDKINDLKDRLTRIEGQGVGKAESRVNTKDVWGYAIGGIMFLIAAITVILTIMKYKQ